MYIQPQMACLPVAGNQRRAERFDDHYDVPRTKRCRNPGSAERCARRSRGALHGGDGSDERNGKHELAERARQMGLPAGREHVDLPAVLVDRLRLPVLLPRSHYARVQRANYLQVAPREPP